MSLDIHAIEPFYRVSGWERAVPGLGAMQLPPGMSHREWMQRFEYNPRDPMSNKVTGLSGAQFGDFASDLQSILNQVIVDPALPQVIHNLDRIFSAASSGPASAGPPQVRLANFVGPLDTVAWYLEHRTLGNMMLIGIVLTPVIIGFALGRATKSCKRKSNGKSNGT